MSFGYDQSAAGGAAIARDRSHAVFGQVMGLVAATVAFTALGAYIGRNLTGGTGILFFIGAFACVFGLNFATARGREQLAIALLFGLGLLLGLAIAPIIHVYANANPAALWQAAGATAATVAGLGAIGYATRRDLSYWARGLFWALLGLIAFGVVLIFVRIPHANIIYAVLGIGIFGAYTIFDFNRLRRADMASSVPIAASIFLDIFNIFLFFLQLFGGGGRQ
jgi:modulator of FtsH protease